MTDETPEEQKAREEKEEAERKEILRLAEEAMHQRKGTGFQW